MIDDTPSSDVGREHPPLAGASGAAKAADPVELDCGGRGSEHGVRAGAGAGGDDPRDTRPDRATRFVETTRGLLSYTELAPLLAERVTHLEADVFRGVFANTALDDDLLRTLHRGLCGDLIPEWAGRWRTVEVAVGRLEPPPPHQLPVLMRDYGLDLQARWPAATASFSEATLEWLAFAEGRFLTIHPFRDFNGRTIRLFLVEVLRRLDFPLVVLAPETELGRSHYFAALEAADEHNWQPLIDLWRERLSFGLHGPTGETLDFEPKEETG